MALHLVAGVIVAANVSRRPFVWYVGRQFADGIGVTQVTPAIYLEPSQKVRAQKEIDYPSRFKNNQLDVLRPTSSNGQIYPITDKLTIPRKLVTFQVIGRTLGTDLQEHGTMKVAHTALRHASIKTTANVYVQPIPAAS